MKATPEIWDAHAAWWKATFTDGADPEYEIEILPLVAELIGTAERVLDLGCGEGQVARHLAAGGRTGRVVGIDPSAAQLANARDAASTTPHSPAFVRGRAEHLPFGAASFDAAICCLVIEHTEDPDAVLAEAARVVAPGGRFLLVINHPLFQGTGSGFVDDQILGEHYWRVGPYLTEDVDFEEVDPGVVLPFAHRPLGRYVNPLAAADLVLVSLLEPSPRDEFLVGSVDLDLERAIPRLAALLFEHRPAVARAAANKEQRSG